ncbi:MAG: DUF3108 domain-containing protein, partial [bacterium]
DSLAARPPDSLTAVDSLALCVPDGAVDESGYPTIPFGPGETLRFSLNYGLINAGEGTLSVLGVVDSNGHSCLEIESRATSNRFFSAFYKVRDKVVTHLDRRYLVSRFFEKRLREGNYKKYVKIDFDQTGHQASYQDGRVLDILPCTQDILSALYFVRTLDLEAGRTYGVTTHSSYKNYSLQVIFHGRETVEVPAGTFDCYVVEPVIEGEGLFKHEGKLTLWLTADEYRIPVLMKTKVVVGSIDATLEEYSLAAPPDSE